MIRNTINRAHPKKRLVLCLQSARVFPGLLKKTYHFVGPQVETYLTYNA